MVPHLLDARQPLVRFLQAAAEEHVASLATKFARLQREIEERAGGLLDQRDELIAKRLWLQNELDNVGAG